MNGPVTQMLDPSALGIVVLGTALATMARGGFGDLRTAAVAIAHLWRRDFDEVANRSSLARALSLIKRHGPLSAEVQLPPDSALAKMLDQFMRSGEKQDIHAAHSSHRSVREARRARAIRTFESAGELAPVFGLVGTLFAITQIAPDTTGSSAGAVMNAVATAVLSTLYGVLLGHLICLPLARAIERKGEQEECARERLLDWIDAQLDEPADRPLKSVKDAA